VSLAAHFHLHLIDTFARIWEYFATRVSQAFFVPRPASVRFNAGYFWPALARSSSLQRISIPTESRSCRFTH
jgi:hypothetical protein